MRKLLIIALMLGALIGLTTGAVEAITFTPSGTNLDASYLEPTTNTDASALNDLAFTNVYWRVCPVTGTCTAVYTKSANVPAVLATGGQSKTVTLSTPVLPGQERNVEVYATATDTSGNESAESTHFTKRVDRLSPSAPQ